MKIPNQPWTTDDVQSLRFSLTLCAQTVTFLSSDHQKLEREARICRLLKHPNIGEFLCMWPKCAMCASVLLLMFTGQYCSLECTKSGLNMKL